MVRAAGVYSDVVRGFGLGKRNPKGYSLYSFVNNNSFVLQTLPSSFTHDV